MSEDRLERIEHKLDHVEHRVEQAEQGVERIEAKVDALTSRVDGLEAGQAKLAAKFDELQFAVLTMADGLSAATERMDAGFARTDRLHSMMQSFIDTQGGINRDLSDKDANHERRIVALERRRKGMS